MSITKAGTPFNDNFSVIICSVLVFPVPVAPAINPCQLKVCKGAFTKLFSLGIPSKTDAPKTMELPLKLYEVFISVRKFSLFDIVNNLTTNQGVYNEIVKAI